MLTFGLDAYIWTQQMRANLPFGAQQMRANQTHELEGGPSPDTCRWQELLRTYCRWCKQSAEW